MGEFEYELELLTYYLSWWTLSVAIKNLAKIGNSWYNFIDYF